MRWVQSETTQRRLDCYKILTPSAAKVRRLISLIVGTTFSNVLRAYNGAVRGIVGSRRTKLTF
jgi:hypothetical protein